MKILTQARQIGSAVGLLAFSGMIYAANATLSQQQVNLRLYTAQYDVGAQKYTTQGVSSTPAPTAQHPSMSSEFRLRFGGSCAPNTSLKRSVVSIQGSNQPYIHNWTGSNNLNNATQQIGVNQTQNNRLATACNDELARKIAGGATYNQLKSSPFQLWQTEWGTTNHDLTCSDGSTARKRGRVKVDVQCGAADVKAVKRKERKNAKVLNATATLTGAEMGMKSQNCPVSASLRIYVQTDVPTVVEYQVVTPTGQRSSRRTLPVSLEQSNFYEASTSINFSIPQSTAGGSGGLPGDVSAGGTSSMSIGSTSPGNAGTGGSGSTQAAGTSLNNLQPANLHSNAFRIEILKPQSYRSNSVGYSVECMPRASSHGRGGLTAQPGSTHSNGNRLQSNNRVQNQSGIPPQQIQPLNE